MGTLTHIRVGHDNTSIIPGAGDAWFLDWVEVVHAPSGQRVRFNCGQWFAKNQGDGQIERDLFPGGEKMSVQATERGFDFDFDV